MSIEKSYNILYNLYSLKFINVRRKIRMGKYYFKNDTRLSNYYMCNVKIDNLTFSSSESAYHEIANKTYT